MTKYARFFPDGRVAEIVSADPAISFVASIAKQFEAVPDDVSVNDKKTSKGFEKYVAEEPPEAPALLVELTDASLKTFFTRAERIAFKAAASSDPVIEDFAEMIALKPQPLTAADTIEAIDKLQTLKVLTAARATALKNLEV